MIRILLVQGSAERAGAERMLYNLLKYMDRSRFAPTVLFLSEGPFVDEVGGLGVPVIRSLAMVRVRELWRWSRPIRTIQEAIASTGAEVVHANGEKTSIFAGRAARAMGTRSIGWLHDAPDAGGLSGRFTRWMLARTPLSEVITCSKWMAQAFNSAYHLGANPIVNGLDFTDMPSSSTRSRLNEAPGWPADAVVIGHFGRLAHWKGTDLFLEAAALAAQSAPDARFLVVGDALYGREKSWADSLRVSGASKRLGDRIIFTGYRPDALDLMARCDIVAHCSRSSDPFPTVVLEGMAMGKAVVATRTGGPEEAIVDGSTGVLVQPGDHVEMARAYVSLATDPRRRSAIGVAAMQEAKSRFGAERMAREFEELYANLLTRSKEAI